MYQARRRNGLLNQRIASESTKCLKAKPGTSIFGIKRQKPGILLMNYQVSSIFKLAYDVIIAFHFDSTSMITSFKKTKPS